MKKRIVYMLAIFLVAGCQGPIPVNSISYSFEHLNEAPFSISYPSDWKIKTEIDASDKNYTDMIYYFTHPRNKNCFFTIEILESTINKQDLMSLQNYILAKKTRALQKSFKKEGFDFFRAKTYQSHLGIVKTRKLKILALRKGVERSLSIHIIRNRSRLYLISYQWDDNWSTEAKKIFLKRVHSFRFE